MSKELTRIKLKNMSNSQSLAKEESPSLALAMARLEEKLKQKDSKLEELKQNIYTLEETIVKLKKKEATAAEYS